MWNFIRQQYKKYEEIISYLFFGGLAFVFYMAVYWLAARAIGADNESPARVIAASCVAWVLTVIFAYWTNHVFVFKTKVDGFSGFIRELAGFTGARLATLAVDTLLTLIMINLLDVNHMLTKVVTNIVVTLCNYILSKLFVFKQTKGQ